MMDSEEPATGNGVEISVVEKALPRQLTQTDSIPSTSRSLGVHIPQANLSSISPPPSLLRSDHKRREKLYKILVIGDIGVGKTSVVKRYVHRFFSQQYRATIGVDFALKIINWDQNTVIRLQLWDIAGQERFGQMTRVYYKDAIGAFIVFDNTRAPTFDAVTKWKKDLDLKVELGDGSPVPCVLLGNKESESELKNRWQLTLDCAKNNLANCLQCDQGRDSQIPEGSKMDHFLRENNFSGFFETSAKENIGIDEAARFLLAKIIENDRPAHVEQDSERLRLDAPTSSDPNARKATGSNCSC